MKRNLLFVLLITMIFQSFSQNSKLSLEVNYPLPIDENFIGKNYDGIVDVGGKYRFIDLSVVNIGTAVNASMLSFKKNHAPGGQDFKVTAYAIQPRIFAELSSELILNFRPFAGLGYTFMIFDAPNTFNNLEISGTDKTLNGFNVNFGIAYDITSNFFLQIQYDLVKLDAANEVPDVKFNTNVNILKLGGGIRL